jgi:hypothetical protein
MPTYTTKRPVANSDTQILAFVKEAGIWYADLPEFLEAGLGTRTNLMMVDGADTFLDLLAKEKANITLRIAKQPFQGWQTRMHKIRKGVNQSLLQLIGHAPVDYGAYYKVAQLNGQPHDHQLWLCPVAEYVFGGYPEDIYASVVPQF